MKGAMVLFLVLAGLSVFVLAWLWLLPHIIRAFKHSIDPEHSASRSGFALTVILVVIALVVGVLFGLAST